MDNEFPTNEIESECEIPCDNLLIREKYMEELERCFGNSSTRIVNIYGESGMGKPMLVRQFASWNEHSANIGEFDFSQYEGMSDRVMIDALYDLAATVLKKKIVEKLRKFTVADAVSSKRGKGTFFAKKY